MLDFFQNFFTWAGICYTVALVIALVAVGVSRFYDRWEARIRRRLGKENQALKKRIAELESRFETEQDK